MKFVEIRVACDHFLNWQGADDEPPMEVLLKVVFR
jgi:hypothetical protein